MGNGSRVVFSLSIVFLLSTPIYIWLQSVGNPLLLINKDVPAGQLLYLFSKLAGLYAVTLFAVQILLMLGVEFLKPLFLWKFRYHRSLGFVTLSAVILHVALFTSAASLRGNALALHLLLPTFSEGYYSTMVSLGVVAAYGTVLLIPIGWLVSRKYKMLKNLHGVMAFLVMVLVFVHSYAIGSETTSPVVMAFYVFSASFIILMIVYRKASSKAKGSSH